VSPSLSEPAFDELLEQLKSELPEPLFATVSKKFLALRYAELKIQVLEERLRLKRIQQRCQIVRKRVVKMELQWTNLRRPSGLSPENAWSTTIEAKFVNLLATRRMRSPTTRKCSKRKIWP